MTLDWSAAMTVMYRQWPLHLRERIDVHVTGEPIGRCLERRLPSFEFRQRSPFAAASVGVVIHEASRLSASCDGEPGSAV
ncbi:MAG: hypothetical protein QOH53_666 [Ilumatobacteraceae bacterium]